MSSHSIRSVALVVVLLAASLMPLAFPVAADEAIHLSTDVTNVSLSDGQSSNVTLTIHNNGTSIESYNVSIDSAGLSSVWEIIASEDVVTSVFPTWSKNTTIIVRLGEGGTPSDSGSFDIIVTEPDANISSTTTVFVSVAPSYEPMLENNYSGDILFEQGEISNLTFNAWNYGSVEDTFLLDVEYEPDLTTWWQNQTTVVEPWDEASGNETLMFTQPTNGSSHDLINGAMNVSVEISPLESNVSYLLEVVAEDELGTQVWSWNDTQNGTVSMANLSTTWLPISIGNITMTGTLSSNGTAIDSNSIQICLYTLIGCSSGSSGNNTGGNISQVWSNPVTLDSTYNVGEQSSLAIDSNNHLHVTYLDYTSFNLEYVTYDGSSWSTPVSIDSTGDVGWQSSLAIDSNDNLHVTYYDVTYDNLEYMTYDGSSWSTPVSIDSTGDVGAMSSLAIDSNDHLHVTYLDNTNGNLEYMTYDGSSWSTPVTLDSGYNVGYYSSLAIDSNDNLHVTYQDEVYDNLEYVTYDGSSWSSPVTLDSTGDLGYHSSLAIDSNDNLHVTYLDYTNYNLEYMTYDGSSWSTPVSLDSTDDVGWQSSLAIDSNDNLHVTYLDNTNDNLEYMTHDGSSWSTPVSLDSTDDVGSDSSLAIDSNDNLHVTYYDYTNENLEYMFSSNSAGGNGTGNGTGNSSNSIGPNGLGGNLPANWNVFWQTDELTNIAAGTSMQSLLQIEVPIDAEPDYYGFRLFIASTGGNISTSTLLVIEVTEEYEVSFAFLSQDQDFFASQATNTTIQATNLGNGQQNYSMQLTVDAGPCVASLIETTAHEFDSGESKDIDVQVVVAENATASSSCDFTIDAETDIDNELTITAGTFSFTIEIDEFVDFSMVLPEGGISVTPAIAYEYEIRVNNTGSDTVTYYLDVANNNGLTTTIISSSGVLVETGQVGVWTVSTDADIGQIGQLIQEFSITYSSVTVSAILSVEVLPIASLEMNGPIDGRISVTPGQSSTVSVQLINTGTQDLNLVASLFGLPAGAEVELSHTNLQLTAGQNSQVNITVEILSSTSAGSHMLTFSYGGNGTSASLSLDLQISQKVEVLLSGTTSRLVAGPISGAELSFDVTNLGTTSDTLHITLQDNGASQWFEFALSSTSLSLDAGESSGITLGVREAASGAPAEGVIISLLVTSSSDTTIMDSMNLTIESLQAGATITVISDVDSAKPGETIYGSVVVTNSGTGIDDLLLTTVGDFDCGISEILSLDAGASSQAITWACVIPENAAAGNSYFTFRVTSSARTTFLEEVAEVYTVEPVWDNAGLVFITIGDSELTVPNSGGSSMIITLSNQANSDISGNLSVIGIGDGLFSIEWQRMSDQVITSEYALGPGQSVDFSVQFNSLVSTKSHAELTIRSISQVGSSTILDDSSTFTVEIEGPQLPPSGISLPLGLSMSNSASINAMAAGWITAILLLVVVRMMRNNSSQNNDSSTKDEDEEDVEEEEEEAEEELGYNECRMSDDNKVSCPSCDSRLGVPRGSTPPFRFSCPSCDNKIRVIE